MVAEDSKIQQFLLWPTTFLNNHFPLLLQFQNRFCFWRFSCFDCLFQRAYPRYESALNITVEQGDRFGQLLVLSGMTKTLVMMKQLLKVCLSIDLSVCLSVWLSVGLSVRLLKFQCHFWVPEKPKWVIWLIWAIVGHYTDKTTHFLHILSHFVRVLTHYGSNESNDSSGFFCV